MSPLAIRSRRVVVGQQGSAYHSNFARRAMNRNTVYLDFDAQCIASM